MENSSIAKKLFSQSIPSSILSHFPLLNSKFFTSLSAFITFLEGRGIPLFFILQMESWDRGIIFWLPTCGQGRNRFYRDFFCRICHRTLLGSSQKKWLKTLSYLQFLWPNCPKPSPSMKTWHQQKGESEYVHKMLLLFFWTFSNEPEFFASSRHILLHSRIHENFFIYRRK